MSLPSFKLSKSSGGTWFAEGALPSGRAFRIDCGKGTRDRAEGVAEIRLKAKMASSTGSRARWQRYNAEKAKGAAGGARGETLVPGEGVEPASGSPSSSPPASPAAPPVDAEALRAKLLGLGDAQPLPIEPDRVIPPDGQRDDTGAESADELDSEGGELIASLLAKGATLGIVALANAPLKKRKPPMRGEPHEKGLEWFHDGLEVQLGKLIGKTSTLGPTGKIFAGAAIIVGSIWMTAEPIDGAAAPAPPPEAAAQPAPSSTANGHAPPAAPPEKSLAVIGSPLGVFGAERKDQN